MDKKIFFLYLLIIGVVFAADNKNNDVNNIGSGVAEDEDDQGSGENNITAKDESGKTRATPLDLQQRYWPLCDQLRQFVPQLCLRDSVAEKCSNVCGNMEPGSLALLLLI